MSRDHFPAAPHHLRGVTLIELMIALILGLLISAAALSVFESNRLTFAATENLSRIQENSRVAFELMTRDIREAGGGPCGSDLPVANVLNNAGTTWWGTWTQPVRGYENGAAAGSVAGTDAIEVMSTSGTGLSVISHNPSAAQFRVSGSTASLNDGDIVMVCDFNQASIFQISNVNPANSTVVHNTGAVVTPGNCSKGLGIPTVCTATGTAYTYGLNSVIARLRAVRWYIANNGRGSRSLYRATLANTAGTVTAAAQEVAEGVEDMQITYLSTGGTAYNPANGVTDWSVVSAVRIDLQIDSPDAVGTNGARLTRPVEHTIALRNRSL